MVFRRVSSNGCGLIQLIRMLTLICDSYFTFTPAATILHPAHPAIPISKPGET